MASTGLSDLLFGFGVFFQVLFWFFGFGGLILWGLGWGFFWGGS